MTLQNYFPKHFTLVWFLIILLICLNLPPLFIYESHNGSASLKTSFFLSLFGFGLVFLKKGKFSFSLNTILVLTFLFLILIIKTFQHKLEFSDFSTSLILLSFLVIDKVLLEKYFLIFIKSSLIVCYLIISLQYFHFIDSNNTNFRVTGFFYNPNPLAIYLGTLLFIFMIYIKDYQHRNQSEILYNMLILIFGFMCLISLQCRTVYIGIVITGIFLFRNKIAFMPKRTYFLVLPLLFLFFVGIYQIKSKSSFGRIYIWKLCSEIFYDKYLTGVGVNNFQVAFSEKQVDFFHDSKNEQIYGDFESQIDYAFCDLLQFSIEYGSVVGGILILIFFFVSSKIFTQYHLKNKDSLFISSYSGLIFLIICSLTNYVFYVEQIKLLALLLLAIILLCEKKAILSLNFNHLKKLIVIICVLLFFYSTLNFYKLYQYHLIRKNIFPHRNVRGFENITKLYVYHKNNYRFLFDVAFFNVEFYPDNLGRSISFLEESRRLYIHNTNTIFLAGIYLRNKQFDKAEDLYLFYFYSNIKKLEPKYALANFYFKSRQRKKFNALYFKLINSDFKEHNYRKYLNYKYNILNHE